MCLQSVQVLKLYFHISINESSEANELRYFWLIFIL